ncbi:malate dehydrogenase [Listeria floridensis FSL S10-1187]|uniref:Malate dehydrogenase n=1 Tax=Listeria floridensis FSL S10-1187 TaxID=1265817 RepID=A0ABN0RI30_9LIST|nr:NAD-dependent malic enzyme [Listeria floridensis]EUJ33575.1 malate dehydrogenase [Listeria floridensis FSL S10-1187]
MPHLTGKELLQNPFYNKGLAFTEEERSKYQLHGLLPIEIRSLAEQAELVYQKLASLSDSYQKNQYLMTIYHSNRILFYRVVSDHIKELLPVIYTPTIAESVIHYSRDFSAPSESVFLDSDHPERIEASLLAASADLDHVDLLVITDGEGVLGIGDWGIGGVMIAVGKLAVYTIASGIHPKRVLPIVIDNGTNRAELLNDPHYLGKKKPRKTGTEYLTFIDAFIQKAKAIFPNVLFHWEDFGRDNASVILEKYRNEVTTFNDDIQGTGVMMAAAVHAVAEVTKKPVTEQRYLIFGAGTAGVGVTEQIREELVRAGLTEPEAVEQFYLIDRHGLITADMENLTAGQKKFARTEPELHGLTSLAEIIEAVKPSVLIGTSGQAGAFTEEAVRKMASFHERPAIMPISNPTHLAEAKAADLIEWTDGKALVVTGSPSDPVSYGGVTYQIGQANNALLYPGLGLGTVLAKASRVTENMLSQAAGSITRLQELDKRGAPLLPPVEMVREVSRVVTEAVVQAAIEDGVAQAEIQNVAEMVEAAIWKADY